MNENKVRKTHASVKGAVRAVARRDKVDPSLVYSKLWRGLFLIGLSDLSEGWVIKGGTNMQCILPDARATTDIDTFPLAKVDTLEQAAQELIDSMDGKKVGIYSFRVERSESKASTLAGKSIRLRATVISQQKKAGEFPIDVSLGSTPAASITKVKVAHKLPVNIEGVPDHYHILSYPVESQLADKVAAIYKTYEGRTSTRYRDLYDIGVIALNLSPAETEFRSTLKDRFKAHGVVAPDSMQFPSNDWPSNYKRLFGQEQEKLLHDPHDALRIAQRMVDPILSSRADLGRVWNPRDQEWQAPLS